VVSHVLLGFGTFIALLTASMIGRVAATHFAIGWWALTFPCAAFANLAQTYALEFPGLAPRLAAGAALAFASLIVAAVTVLTVRALAQGELVPKPEE
jgi:tellurite resistance protein